jgi:hypothetical protein
VRNSGIRTLFASLVSHGSRISGELWRHCVWELLLPLLENVKHLAATSSKEESAGRELGKAGGKTVLMLVHHRYAVPLTRRDFEMFEAPACQRGREVFAYQRATFKMRLN